MNSGVQYASRSAEFRLAMMHSIKMVEYKRQSDALLGSTLLGIYLATSLEKFTDEARQKRAKEVGEHQASLFEMLDPLGTPKKTVREKKDDTKLAQAQAKYLETLASVGTFNSPEQIKAALTALNQTIQGA